MDSKHSDEIRHAVRNKYGQCATGEKHLCGDSAQAPCCGERLIPAHTIAMAMGYSPAEIESVPEGANMGLGCGNPKAIASLRPGETVLDLGSGGGFDCFLAAKEVGETGKVIGVDMTPEMVSKARENAHKIGANNIEFRLGEIEHLPVADESIDVIMSNCVINLSPNKQQVCRDAFRVLKRGGRLAISDVVATAPLPEEVTKDLAVVAACVGGAEAIDNIKRMLQESGFQDIKIQPKEESRKFIKKWVPGKAIEDYVVAATIEAVKPISTPGKENLHGRQRD